jgi:hypothetical protein
LKQADSVGIKSTENKNRTPEETKLLALKITNYNLNSTKFTLLGNSFLMAPRFAVFQTREGRNLRKQHTHLLMHPA